MSSENLNAKDFAVKNKYCCLLYTYSLIRNAEKHKLFLKSCRILGLVSNMNTRTLVLKTSNFFSM